MDRSRTIGVVLLIMGTAAHPALARNWFQPASSGSPYRLCPTPRLAPVPADEAPAPAAQNAAPAAPSQAAPEANAPTLPEAMTQEPAQAVTEIQTTTARVTEAGNPEPSAIPTSIASGAAGSGPATLKVNNKHLQFAYDYRDVGPSGVSGVEVWYTRDGKTWQQFGNGVQRADCSVDVPEEGTYGFTLVARTGFGGGKQAPATGEQPQLWVEVDTTKPVVFLTGVQPTNGGRTLTIRWTATDKNLGPRPISLFYADQKTGPWLPIVASVENTGAYQWQIPASTPAAVWLRVQAADLAGNSASDDSSSPVQVDLAEPAVANVRLVPAAP